jgi:hypothetical protein
MDDSFTPAIRKAALVKIDDETFVREYGVAFDE